GRQVSFASGTTRTYTPGISGINFGKQRAVICYNNKREGNMYNQCTKPKQKTDDSRFKDKVLLVQIQVNGQVLHEKELALLVDPGVIEYQNIQSIITHNAAYQADDLDAYDSDCVELNTSQVALMANLSRFSSDALVEVHNPDNVNNLTNQDVQYLQETQQLEPKIYDGNVILNTYTIEILDSEETLMLAEESLSRERHSNTEVERKKIKSLSGNVNKDKVKKDIEEIEIINIELDHRVSKLIAENEHLKQTYKQLYDSIKPARVRSKEQCDTLINQVNQMSVEISDLNAKLQEQGLVITALKNDLRKLKGKALVENYVTKHTVDPNILKINVQPLSPIFLNNRTSHSNYLKHTQEQAELLIIFRQTCPSINNPNNKLVTVTPKNKDKRVRFAEPVTSIRTTKTRIDSSSNLVSNKIALSSIGVKPSTSVSGSQLSGNTKKDKIQRPPNSTQKNKVEANPGNVKSSLKNKKSVVEPQGTTNVHHSKINANSKLICAKCNGCMLSDNHDLCVLNSVNDVRAKSKSINKISKRKVVQIVLWYLDSDCSKHMTEDRSQLTNFVSKFFGTVKFRNNQVAKITGYGDYHIRNVTILRVYYVEGLRHNLFSVGQFCDSNLEVAFRLYTCFIRNLEGDDLMTGPRGNNLYTLSIRNMMASSIICLLSKASKTKSRLWHLNLSHLNFSVINHLARHGLVQGLPKLKFETDHL
ncbi:retrovirus-related pol polyprotein from transposon TNT 1-94, partial [Tanacetum coccineum]